MRLLSVEIDGKCLTREHDVLEALNRHFSLVGPKLHKTLVSRLGDNCLQNIKAEKKVMTFKTVDNRCIMNATGSDKVATKIVKDVDDLVSKLC